MPPGSNSPSGNQNTFFGIKVSKPGINVNSAGDSQLIYKNDYSAETFYTDTGSMLFGKNANGSLGMTLSDSFGYTLFTMNGQTWSWYDKSSGKNVMQIGLLPDGSYGFAVAAYGYNVSDGFS